MNITTRQQRKKIEKKDPLYRVYSQKKPLKNFDALQKTKNKFPRFFLLANALMSSFF